MYIPGKELRNTGENPYINKGAKTERMRVVENRTIDTVCMIFFFFMEEGDCRPVRIGTGG